MAYMDDQGQVTMMAPNGEMSLVPAEEVADYLAFGFEVVCGFSA